MIESTRSRKFPDVLGVDVQPSTGNAFDFHVTISSPYDSAQRYANAFRVQGTDGTVFGERKLLHDHANEQPFTRELKGVAIPAGVTTIVVQARDQQFGYGGRAVEIALPGR
jgi:hypothetical protein